MTQPKLIAFFSCLSEKFTWRAYILYALAIQRASISAFGFLGGAPNLFEKVLSLNSPGEIFCFCFVFLLIRIIQNNYSNS